MYIVATFEQSIFLELALTAMEQIGLGKDQILAVPMDKRTEPKKVFDTIHRADGFSMLDLGAILGTVFMLLGAIYGYELKWGPIIWGIIGAVGGILLGLLLKLFMVKQRRYGTKGITSEVVILIRCEEFQQNMIEQLLWENQALGIATLRGER
ncbi:hypothetical protein LOK74_14510 [Brevibacillus humidisoli]|uniref:hypothetical protein n=1 Tax=Brevibacillus humidisoli TaxID=2895522 RepID=UPI001E3E498C|nr:hypothetical protein [Brevibacillus humidisoli]UFJ39283.1 hypothetical protein LOK74_14510 [Brevibacillus humidisoli]